MFWVIGFFAIRSLKLYITDFISITFVYKWQTDISNVNIAGEWFLQPNTTDLTFSYLSTRAKFISAEESTGVTFDDFAGQEYIKRELQEIVRILKNDEDFQDKGIYSPKGVLLHGPPGTGKTLLAKAIAGEAGLPFFAANGTDFVEVRPDVS